MLKKAFIISLIITLSVLIGCTNNEATTRQSTTVKHETNLTVNDSDFYLVLNDDNYSSKTIEAVSTSNGENQAITLESSSSSVIIEEMTVRAACKGSADITVRSNEKSETIHVQVLEKIEDMDVLDETKIKYTGRVFEKDGGMAFYNTASSFIIPFIGSNVKAEIRSNGEGAIKVMLDGEIVKTIKLGTATNNLTLVENVSDGIHVLEVLKMTEQGYLKTDLMGVSTDGYFLSPLEDKKLKIEFYGDSITAGFGNLGRTGEFKVNEDGTETYATMVGKHYDAEISVVTHAGISAALRTNNCTFTMMEVYSKVYMYSEIEFDYSKFKADIVVVNLGTNDANAGGLDDEMYDGYVKLIEAIHAKQPNAKILAIYGMMGIDRYIDKEINKAVEHLLEEGIDITYSVVLANRNGDMDHPDIAGHTLAYEQVVELIDHMMGYTQE